MPRPTKAAVRAGDRFASIARAPADTMGGMPASKIETSTASPSSPASLQRNKAVTGATISFMAYPQQSGVVDPLLKRRVS